MVPIQVDKISFNLFLGTNKAIEENKIGVNEMWMIDTKIMLPVVPRLVK